MKNISPILVLWDIYDCIIQVHSHLGRAHVCFHTLNAHSLTWNEGSLLLNLKDEAGIILLWLGAKFWKEWWEVWGEGWIFRTSWLSAPRAGLPTVVSSCSTGGGGTQLRQKSILCWGRKGDISKVGTRWFNMSLEAHIKKHGKNVSQGELLLASFQVLSPWNCFPCCPLCHVYQFLLSTHSLFSPPFGQDTQWTYKGERRVAVRSGFLRAEENGREEAGRKAAQKVRDSFLLVLL